MATFPNIFNSYSNIFTKQNESTYMFKYLADGSTILLKDNFLTYDTSNIKIGKWVWKDNKLTVNFDIGRVYYWDLSLLNQLDNYFEPTPPPTRPKPPTPPKPPKPEPEPEPEPENITDCKWKPSEGMPFRCNKIEDCKPGEGNGSGDTFRKYVNKQFPQIAKDFELNKEGKTPLAYCNTTMKKVWGHPYDSDESPGLKGKTIGTIYLKKLKPGLFTIECKPWETENYFINDYKTNNERDDAAFKMVVAYNEMNKYMLDAAMFDQCSKDIDNDLSWAQNNIVGLHKNPIVKWIANEEPTKGKKFYDEWREKTLVKNESVITNLIERKLNIKKKLKMMNENKKLVGKVSEKLKTKKIEKISENFFKKNYRKFFDSYSKYIKSNNMISEATNEDFKKSFDSIFRGKEDEFRERAIEYVINKLEVNPTSTLANEITNELSKIPAEELFTKEYKIPKAITNAIEKTNQELPSDKTGLEGMFQKSMSFDDELLQQEVRKNLHDYVEDIKDKLINLERKIKNAIIQGL